MSIKKSYLSVALGLSLFLMAGCFLIIGNMIKASVEQKREEVEVLELVGATNSYIRWPYIIEGAVMGLASSLVALSISYGVYSFMSSRFSAFISNWWMGNGISFFGPLDIITVIAVGVGIGVMGAWLNVLTINNGWSAAQKAYAKN